MTILRALRLRTIACACFIATTGFAIPAQACVPDDLQNVLDEIREKFGKVSVISTYRKGARIAGTGQMSYHASCRAVDFHPPSGKYDQVVSWLHKNFDGGVGTYSCSMHHIHIDTGPKIHWHKCQ
jgi:uncharacterized protein YcbK (DUF882 family)